MTQKQNKANQQNAKRSTGPRTALGKTISSQNSVKHGLNQAIDFESDTRLTALVNLLDKEGYSQDEAYSVALAILSHRRVMEACAEQYVAAPEIYGRTEIALIEDLEGDIELGRVKINYSDKLIIQRFKTRVIRENEKLGSDVMQRVKRLGKLIRYQRQSVSQISRSIREMQK